MPHNFISLRDLPQQIVGRDISGAQQIAKAEGVVSKTAPDGVIPLLYHIINPSILGPANGGICHYYHNCYVISRFYQKALTFYMH